MPKFNGAQLDFLKENEVCRFATVSKDCRPQVTPVIYAMDGDAFVIAIDYGTKKLANLRGNAFASLVVDEYGGEHRAVVVEGKCEILEKGKEYKRLLRILFDRFEYYRNNPWKEGESPIIRVTADKTVSWGLGK